MCRYHDMLRKAREEGTVTHVTTLWDSFFEGGRDHRYDKPSVTHIPYLEGDYWPGEAENLLARIAEAQRSAAQGGLPGGENSTLADITVAVGGRFLSRTMPQVADKMAFPHLAGLSARSEPLPAFMACQPEA